MGVLPISPTLIATVRRQHLGGQLLDDGSLKYVIFLSPVRMTPILRTVQEPITSTVGKQAGAFDVVVNGNYYDLTFMGKVDAQLGRAAPANDTLVQGEVVSGGNMIAGDSRPQRFYLAEVVNSLQRKPKDPPFRFAVGQGDPPTGAGTLAAIGNLGPMIQKGLPYGVGNQYRPPATGPARGDPGPALRGALTQRNDNTFASVDQRDDRTGKTIIAWHAKEAALLVGVEKAHDQSRPGEPYSRLTHALRAAGFTDAVFCDGSDSAMLWVKGRMVVAPGERKADTMTVALGFTAGATPAGSRPRHPQPQSPRR